MPATFVPCRHCGAVAPATADRRPVCNGYDPLGQRFALLGSAFFGTLPGILVAGTLVTVLWHRWERRVKLFGDAEDDSIRTDAWSMAAVGVGLVFAVSTLAAGIMVLRTVRFR